MGGLSCQGHGEAQTPCSQLAPECSSGLGDDGLHGQWTVTCFVCDVCGYVDFLEQMHKRAQRRHTFKYAFHFVVLQRGLLRVHLQHHWHWIRHRQQHPDQLISLRMKFD